MALFLVREASGFPIVSAVWHPKCLLQLPWDNMGKLFFVENAYAFKSDNFNDFVLQNDKRTPGWLKYSCTMLGLRNQIKLDWCTDNWLLFLEKMKTWAFHFCCNFGNKHRIMYRNFFESVYNNRCGTLPFLGFLCNHMSRLMTKPTKWHVRPAKTQISLGIRPVWSESSPSAWRKLRSLATHWAHSEDSDQTGRMPRLIWVFAGRTCHFLILS